jgi:hypothetical protein
MTAALAMLMVPAVNRKQPLPISINQTFVNFVEAVGRNDS